MAIRTLFFSVLLTKFFAVPPVAGVCSDVPGEICKCRTKDREIDLNLLNDGDNPRFSAVDPKLSTFKYYFTPCKVLAGPPECTKIVGAGQTISACQQAGPSSHFDIGDIASGTFSGDPSDNTLNYTLTSKVDTTTTRTSIFRIICTWDEARLEFVEEHPTANYNFKLYTSLVCLEDESHDLSTGSILLILFFVFFAVYWIAGFLFMKFVRRAEGVEVIPNYEFWKELPLLIRDGFAFTARGCKGESTYEKI